MLEVLFRNEDILILDKPAGLAVQPGAGVRTSLVEAVERQFGFRPFLIHRLDRDTSGLHRRRDEFPGGVPVCRRPFRQGKGTEGIQGIGGGRTGIRIRRHP